MCSQMVIIVKDTPLGRYRSDHTIEVYLAIMIIIFYTNYHAYCAFCLSPLIRHSHYSSFNTLYVEGTERIDSTVKWLMNCSFYSLNLQTSAHSPDV